MDTLSYYIDAIKHLRTDSGAKKFPGTTHHRAPHKPLLLLTILDLFEQGRLMTNFVPLSQELADLFAQYWALIMPPERPGNLFLPFFHLRNDGFWHLVPHPGMEDVLDAIGQIAGPGQFRETVMGGRFDEELYRLLIMKEARDALRSAVIRTYFVGDMQRILVGQAAINAEVYRYSLALIDTARSGVPLVAEGNDIEKRPAREQGFRRAVVTVYDHRCVLCGVRIVTYDGLSAVTAAHIIPWTETHNDDPRNGLCLCRLCHWAFDAGIATISARYRIRLSSQLGSEGNIPGHLSTLAERPIFEPADAVFKPDLDALKWHTDHVFLK